VTAGSPENVQASDAGRSMASSDPVTSPDVGENAGKLRWYHGVASVGGMIAAPFAAGLYFPSLGMWGVLFIYGLLALLAMMMNRLFAEMAAMFPSKLGGITIYASEAFTGKARPVSVIATFGYWMGYCFSLSFTAASISFLVQAQWWTAGAPVWTFAGVDIAADNLVAIATVVVSAVLAYLGPNVFARISLILSGALLVILILVCFAPLFSMGSLQLSTATFTSPGWQTIAVSIYVIGFSVFGTELVATMAPTFRDIVHDTKRALRVAGAVVLFAVIVVPISATAILGEEIVGQNPLNFPSLVVASIFGGSPTVIMIVNIVQIAMLVNLMVIITSGCSQVLAAMAEEDLAIRQVGRRSKSGAPVVAIFISTVLNVVLLVVSDNPIAILLASNFGYIIAIVLVVTGYVVLKRNPHPEVSPALVVRFGVPIALFAIVVIGGALLVSLYYPELAGGTFAQSTLAFGVLVLGVAGYYYRIKVQNRGRRSRV
jgi:amino acid transporter